MQLYELLLKISSTWPHKVIKDAYFGQRQPNAGAC